VRIRPGGAGGRRVGARHDGGAIRLQQQAGDGVIAPINVDDCNPAFAEGRIGGTRRIETSDEDVGIDTHEVSRGGTASDVDPPVRGDGDRRRLGRPPVKDYGHAAGPVRAERQIRTPVHAQSGQNRAGGCATAPFHADRQHLSVRLHGQRLRADWCETKCHDALIAE
jgi:hypothetical protein